MSMVQEPHTLAFRWLLPITQLVLSMVVRWPLHTILIQQVRLSIREYRHQQTPLPHLAEGQQFRILEVPLSPQEQMERETFQSLEKREWVPTMLNLPAGLMQLPYAILNPSKQEWMPTGMDFKTWRVISWPLIGILFWWSGGRGLEALLAARRHLVRPKLAGLRQWSALRCFCSVPDCDWHTNRRRRRQGLPNEILRRGCGDLGSAWRHGGRSTGCTMADHPKAARANSLN
jgi:hypothetical protein